MFERKYIICFIVAFALLVISTILGTLVGYSTSYVSANQTVSEVHARFETVSIASIFINNFTIAVISFIPVYGVLFVLLVSFNTGYTLGCIGLVAGKSMPYVFSVYFLDVIFVVEYVSYSLALAESMYLVYLAIKEGKSEFIDRLRYNTWKLVLLVALLLFVGAVLEWLIIAS
jgi:hypothetical protein